MTLFDLISLVWSHPVKEPIVDDGSCSLIADIAARGVWQPHVTTLFDIRVVYSDAPSYLIKKPPIMVLKTAEKEKSKYGSDCKTRHATFTPIYLTIDGLLAPEMSQFITHLAVRLWTSSTALFSIGEDLNFLSPWLVPLISVYRVPSPSGED